MFAPFVSWIIQEGVRDWRVPPTVPGMSLSTGVAAIGYDRLGTPPPANEPYGSLRIDSSRQLAPDDTPASLSAPTTFGDVSEMMMMSNGTSQAATPTYHSGATGFPSSSAAAAASANGWGSVSASQHRLADGGTGDTYGFMSPASGSTTANTTPVTLSNLAISSAGNSATHLAAGSSSSPPGRHGTPPPADGVPWRKVTPPAAGNNPGTVPQLSLLPAAQATPAAIDTSALYPPSLHRYIHTGYNFCVHLIRALNVPWMVFSSAMHYFHRFLAARGPGAVHPVHLAAGCVFLAAKADNIHRVRLADLIKHAYGVHFQECNTAAKMTEYDNRQRQITECEMMIIHSLNFDLIVIHPTTYVFQLVGDDERVPRVKLSRRVLAYVSHTPLSLTFSAREVAEGVVAFAIWALEEEQVSSSAEVLNRCVHSTAVARETIRLGLIEFFAVADKRMNMRRVDTAVLRRRLELIACGAIHPSPAAQLPTGGGRNGASIVSAALHPPPVGDALQATNIDLATSLAKRPRDGEGRGEGPPHGMADGRE